MITELKPTNLIAVEVAPDAHAYDFFSNSLYYWGIQDKDKVIWIGFPCKVLGEVVKDKIGFDVEPYVGRNWYSNTFSHIDYNYSGSSIPSENYKNGFMSADKSFYSLLAANGRYFENPLEWEKKAYLFKGSENSWGLDDLARWQSYEEKLIRGKLLILEKL